MIWYILLITCVSFIVASRFIPEPKNAGSYGLTFQPHDPRSNTDRYDEYQRRLAQVSVGARRVEANYGANVVAMKNPDPADFDQWWFAQAKAVSQYNQRVASGLQYQHRNRNPQSSGA